MTDIKSMTESQLADFFKGMGQPAFRARQVFTWLHRGVRSFDEMTDLSKPLRSQLAETCFITAPTVARKQTSRLDGTIKYLWELSDGNCIETVLMQYHHGNTVCISSQVGCRMGCAFCASTIAGKVRDLRPSELLDQVLFTQLDSGLPAGGDALEGRFAVAYEPVWAIGTGKVAGPDEVLATHAVVRRLLCERLGETGNRIPILYGGSVKPANAGKLIGLDNVDGLLIGGASLDAQSFVQIIRA